MALRKKLCLWNLKYQVMGKMKVVVDNILEYITIEICMKKKEKCYCELYLYSRTPGSTSKYIEINI